MASVFNYQTTAAQTGHFFPGPEESIQPILQHQPVNDWFYYLSLAILILIAAARHFSPYRFFFLIEAFFSYRKTELLQNEGKVIRNGTSLILILVVILVAGILLYHLQNYLYLPSAFPSTPPYLTVVYFGIAVAGLWLLKSLLILVGGGLFKTPYPSYLILSNMLIVNVVGALIMLFFGIVYFYSPNHTFLYLPLYFVITFYIYRLIRNFIIGRKAGAFSIFYIILYLCTLEILPVLVIYKMIKDYIYHLG